MIRCPVVAFAAELGRRVNCTPPVAVVVLWKGGKVATYVPVCPKCLASWQRIGLPSGVSATFEYGEAAIARLAMLEAQAQTARAGAPS